MTGPLVLYVEAFWLSPFTASVFVCLREKGLDFHTSIAVTRPGVGAVDPIMSRSLTGTAPVLQHGNFWLAESLAIIEYLEEVFPPPQWPGLLPGHVEERARARQVLSWLRTGQEVLRRERPIEHVLYPRAVTPAPLSPAGQRCADELIRIAGRLGASASGHIHDDLGILDVELAFALMRLLGSGAELPESLAAYVRAVWARPSVREFVEHPRPPHPPET